MLMTPHSPSDKVTSAKAFVFPFGGAERSSIVMSSDVIMKPFFSGVFDSPSCGRFSAYKSSK